VVDDGSSSAVKAEVEAIFCSDTRAQLLSNDTCRGAAYYRNQGASLAETNWLRLFMGRVIDNNQGGGWHAADLNLLLQNRMLWI